MYDTLTVAPDGETLRVSKGFDLRNTIDKVACVCKGVIRHKDLAVFTTHSKRTNSFGQGIATLLLI